MERIYTKPAKILSEHEEHLTMDSSRRADPRQQQRTQRYGVPKDCTIPRDGEEALSEYRELRKKGLKVKGWWFRARAKQIVSEMQPDAPPFGSSDGWFMRFKTRHRISKRRATNSCQKEPDDKRGAIQRFHRSIRRSAKEGEQVGPLGILLFVAIFSLNAKFAKISTCNYKQTYKLCDF